MKNGFFRNSFYLKRCDSAFFKKPCHARATRRIFGHRLESPLSATAASFLFLSALALTPSLYAQTWPNPCFNGTAGWTATYSTVGGWTGAGCAPPAATSVSGGTAPNTAGGLSKIPPNGCCSTAVQIYSSRGDSNNEDWAQIEETSTVPTNGDTCLTFWFAGVFESHHYLTGDTAPGADSYLQINVIVGGTAVVTLNYSWENNLASIVQLSNAVVPAVGDGTYCDINGTPNQWGYLPWTEYAINLCKYAGEQVTFQATDYDCDAGGHYGFGYLSCLNWAACGTPDVTLTKTNSPTGTVTAGQTITYTLNYANLGTAPASGVTVNDSIPADTTLVPNSITSNPAIFYSGQNGNNVYWDVGNIAAGGSGTLGFQVTVNASSCVTIVNQAYLTNLLAPCP
jgi:uncharacterized repeat protein (TIGR01451 family)